ncbi:MAG: hypothetical protein ACYCYR_13630 [Desulfobulbaceae bacterium]
MTHGPAPIKKTGWSREARSRFFGLQRSGMGLFLLFPLLLLFLCFLLLPGRDPLASQEGAALAVLAGLKVFAAALLFGFLRTQGV